MDLQIIASIGPEYSSRILKVVEPSGPACNVKVRRTSSATSYPAR